MQTILGRFPNLKTQRRAEECRRGGLQNLWRLLLPQRPWSAFEQRPHFCPGRYGRPRASCLSCLVEAGLGGRSLRCSRKSPFGPVVPPTRCVSADWRPRRNVQPRPKPSLVTVSVPLCASARPRAIYIPSPRLPDFRQVEAEDCLKGSKTCGRKPDSIPAP